MKIWENISLQYNQMMGGSMTLDLTNQTRVPFPRLVENPPWTPTIRNRLGNSGRLHSKVPSMVLWQRRQQPAEGEWTFPIPIAAPFPRTANIDPRLPEKSKISSSNRAKSMANDLHNLDKMHSSSLVVKLRSQRRSLMASLTEHYSKGLLLHPWWGSNNP